MTGWPSQGVKQKKLKILESFEASTFPMIFFKTEVFSLV